MPKLIRLYITHVAIGFGISATFLGVLLAFDVVGLRHLVLETPSGWLAGVMIFMFSGSIFAGVQFGIAVMRMAASNEPPHGGLRQHVGLVPAPVAVPRRKG